MCGPKNARSHFSLERMVLTSFGCLGVSARPPRNRDWVLEISMLWNCWCSCASVSDCVCGMVMLVLLLMLLLVVVVVTDVVLVCLVVVVMVVCVCWG